MPRRTKQHSQLISGRIPPFLLEREDTDKKLTCCRKVLASLEKSRSSERRAMHREQLDNAFKRLCVDSTDVTMYRDKLKKARSDCERESRKRAEFCDLYHEEQRKHTEYEYLTTKLECCRSTMTRMEEDYEELLAEKREFERKYAAACEELEDTKTILEDTESRLKAQQEPSSAPTSGHST